MSINKKIMSLQRPSWMYSNAVSSSLKK